MEELEKKATLTVFTPAYNRAYTLHLCYESLLRQTCKDFKWLVIDDGSTDNTKDLVQSWIDEGKISIAYFYQENQGMHGAHNAAYRLIDTELNTCIDSDDFMPDDAVEKIISFWKMKGNEKYAGLVGLDVTKEGKIIGTKFPDGLEETTLSGFYARGGRGDKKLVYRTEVINVYPEYPLFEGEKFVPLDYKYLLIDQDYKLLILNTPLVSVEYMPDGSTQNILRQYRKNPKGFAFSRLSRIQYGSTFKERFKNAIHLVSSAIFIGDYRYLLKTPRPVLILLALPCGILLNIYIRIKT
ncbi:MAG: glycosyltransferase family 2 protein [Bacteroidales bacterium]|jgi:glycosyltransferase involved in cell wall biosynthesis|nr:glycosyltransferase family 2 protein [Bacteroidales bacterium]